MTKIINFWIRQAWVWIPALLGTVTGYLLLHFTFRTSDFSVTIEIISQLFKATVQGKWHNASTLATHTAP